MREFDLPQGFLFLLFLALFMLVGIYPAWKRTATRIGKFLTTFSRPEALVDEAFATARPKGFAEQLPPQLNDYEIIVLRQLAQNRAKGLTRRQLNADLHLEPATLKTTLQSLLRRELVLLNITSLFSIRFSLTESGRAYAVEQGYILSIHNLNRRP